MEKISKSFLMEFSSIEVGDCNFTMKEFHQRFFPVNFDIGFYEILPVFWKQLQCFPYYTSTVALLKQLWFDLLNKWTLFPISRFPIGALWIDWPRKVETFFGKCQQWSSVLIKLQSKVSKTGLRNRRSPWAFSILE